MKIQTVYKAVRPIHYSITSFQSAMIQDASPHLTSYVIGKTTINETMPLFALKSLENTKDPEWEMYYILECNAVVSPKQPIRRANICYSNERFELFWKQIWSKKKVTVPVESLSSGTVFCSSVTPIKVIRNPLY